MDAVAARKIRNDGYPSQVFRVYSRRNNYVFSRKH